MEHGVLQKTRKTASSGAYCQNFRRPDNNLRISKGTATESVKNRIKKLPVSKVSLLDVPAFFSISVISE